MSYRSSIYISDELYSLLRITPFRGPSAAITDISARYRRLISSSYSLIPVLFTPEEISFLSTISLNDNWSPETIPNAFLVLILSLSEEKFIHLPFSKTSLLTKINALTNIEHFALIEFIQDLYWASIHKPKNTE